MSRRRPKKKKRQVERRRAARRALLRRAKKTLADENVVIGRPADGVKMSEVLEAFVEPYKDSAGTKKRYETLLATALIAWNVTLFPEAERASFLDELIDSLPEEARQDGKEIIHAMIVRKERFFSRYRRLIVDFEVSDTGSGWYLTVASTPFPASDGLERTVE